MMLKNLASFTVPTGPYPAYVSINENLAGDIEITTRGEAPSEPNTVVIPREIGREMLRQALKKARVNA